MIRLRISVILFLLFGMSMAGALRGASAEEPIKAGTPAGATVVGVVKFDGPKPRRRRISLREKGGKVSECEKLHKTPLLDENVLISDKGEVANAFIYVSKGYDKKKKYAVPKKSIVLNQKDCMFRPRVQGIQVGQEFLARNSDPLIHNVRGLALRNRPFNMAQPGKSADRKRVFTRWERPLQIKCDIHPWMKAFVFVLEHPYFSVTDAKGQFKITGLPAGDYTLTAWHEEFGKQKMKITVAATGSSKVNFAFKPKPE